MSKKTAAKFWMIYTPDGNPLPDPYDTKQKAQNAAWCAALDNPGKTYVILETLCEFTTGVPPMNFTQHKKDQKKP